MAAGDPPPTTTTTPTVQESKDLTDALKGVENAAYNSQAAMSSYDQVVVKAGKVMTDLSSGLNKVMSSMNSANAMTNNQVAAFTLLATGAINVQKSFDGLGDVSGTGISTFGDQLKYVQDTLLSGNIQDGVQKMAEAAKRAGASMGQIGDAMSKGGTLAIRALGGLLERQMTSADNTYKLSAAYMHQMAATGMLSKVYEKAGSDLGNMNAVMDEQSTMLGNVGMATHKLPRDVNEAFNGFMRIPGAIDSVIKVAGVAGGSLNGLTAALKLADGTGRNVVDVNRDLSQATKLFTKDTKDSQENMGKSMEFTARFTELSTKLNISFDTMHEGLTNATSSMMQYTNAGKDAFKMTEGVAGMMNEYAKGLMDAGMSADQATKTIGGMSDTMGKLNTAQRAYLSAQSGGPGGLTGAAQIGEMIRTGNIEGIKQKVMETMKKQFGSIVTQEDVATGKGSASQFERQKMMLQQGPLGGLAKTELGATQMLDMLKAKETGKAGSTTPLDPMGLSKAINQGSKWEEKSAGALDDIVQNTNSIALSVGANNLTIVQRSQGTASTGATKGEEGDDKLRAIQKQRVENTNSAMERGGLGAQQVRQAGLSSADDQKKNMAGVASRGVDAMKRVPGEVVRAAQVEGQQALDAFNIDSSGATREPTPEEEIKNRKAVAKPVARPKAGLTSKETGAEMEKYNFRQSAIVNPMAQMAATKSPAQAAPTAQGTTTATTTGPTASNEIKVQVTGYCLACKREIEGGEHSRATHVGTAGA